MSDLRIIRFDIADEHENRLMHDDVVWVNWGWSARSQLRLDSINIRWSFLGKGE